MMGQDDKDFERFIVICGEMLEALNGIRQQLIGFDGLHNDIGHLAASGMAIAEKLDAQINLQHDIRRELLDLTELARKAARPEIAR